ncbi:MAG: sulfotransferase [Rhodobacteraceae bacterium]|nr:sulfotransferase [Paracoccaceae bacterium]
MTRFRAFVICTSPRSGSTMLCKLLQETGVAGCPGSHFHRTSLQAWLDSYNLHASSYGSEKQALTAIFAAAIAKGSGNTGTFGLRLQQHSLSFFLQKLAVLYPEPSGDQARLNAAFGPSLFIHLTRENKLEQAISRLKAEQTGLWHRNADGSELERLSAPRQPIYDAAAITAHVKDLTEADLNWNIWFTKQGIQPLRITYDELSDAPTRVLAGVLKALGQDPAIAQNITPPTAKLSDEVSREWAHRFRAENNE